MKRAAYVVAFVALGCSSGGSNSPGGSGGASNGGSTSASGGGTALGGAANSGGARVANGGSASGGAPANSGGAGVSGGAPVNGGAPATAGSDAGGTAGNSQAGGGGMAGALLDPKLCPTQPDGVVARLDAALRPPGAAIASTATRPQLSQEQADARFTILKALARGGDFSVNAGTITYARDDNWDPLSASIGDVTKVVPGYTVALDGSGTHTSIQAAITEAIYLATCPRVYIRIMPGTYRETVVVPAKTSAPPLTLYGIDSDASKTVIVRGNSAAGTEAGEPSTISASATFTNSLPSGFQAKNLTIANDYAEGKYPGDDQSAVALLNQGDRAAYENVRIVGNRFALYVKSTAVTQVSRTYFRDCYVEGDEEFIAGRGTAVFDRSTVHSLGSRKPEAGIIAAPSTVLTNPYGFLFINSVFSGETSASGVFLGRQWFEGAKKDAVGKMVVRNSQLGAHVRRSDPWAAYPGRVTDKDASGSSPIVLYGSDDYFAPANAPNEREAYLGEYANDGPGAVP